MSLRVPFNKLLPPNEDEVFLAEAYAIINTEVMSAIKKAQTLVSIGKRKESLKYYKAITYYYVMIDYIFYKRKWLIRKSYECEPEKAESKFKTSCVRSNLVCISADLGIDLVNLYNKLDTLCENTPPGEFADFEFNKPGFVD